MNAAHSEREGLSRLDREIARLAIDTVCREFGVPAAELRALRKNARIAFARQVAVYLTHVVGQVSLTDVARLFRRDRKTIVHACRVIEDRREGPVFERQIVALEAELRERLALSLARRAGRFAPAGDETL